MIIDEENYEIGNKAMASVLLLYYHLLSEGGITNDQTVYLDQDDFDGFSFLDIEIEEFQKTDLDERLIKEGAIVYLICELNDMIIEYEDSYLRQPLANKVIEALKKVEKELIPELSALLKLLSVPETELNYVAYKDILHRIYKNYVHGFFANKLKEKL
ncbi:hypothetical protein VIBNISO65_1630003 [Vibrio nigripulchritudo SO65]|uniref:hypothetical protein n=2 Tax=Vibrio nigripulchritudo TaxID=28173 RepID=UPI0003B18123|nr:hypothetical protein [Vibrio nigripulchritudo]CCN37505.1 hypothetical protein VIBNIAM115_620003 [Vibrio nigripulchritudo AM115]CCN41677.1 hypothetical protein VIBNIFTn2_170010 [Vibrio nigripulchritudo FTn2]CCN63373.1 hypothetical protein VIBNIPon4_1250003 [Vibrio nigripulchritudo POn4]CCN76713.1 hypothetical protein VIBNISO65_1630003 [Vibrio nigripulchritudo SO65]